PYTPLFRPIGRDGGGSHLPRHGPSRAGERDRRCGGNGARSLTSRSAGPVQLWVLSSAGVLFARPRWDRDGPPSRGRSLRRPRRCSPCSPCHPQRANLSASLRVTLPPVPRRQRSRDLAVGLLLDRTCGRSRSSESATRTSSSAASR